MFKTAYKIWSFYLQTSLVLWGLTACGSPPPAEESKYQLKTLWDDPYFSVQGFDINGDGADELIMDLGEQMDILDSKGASTLHSVNKLGSRFHPYSLSKPVQLILRRL